MTTTPADPARALLARRAAKLAERAAEGPQRDVVATVLCVRVNEAALGIPRDAVTQILPLQPVTRLPGTPPAIAGIIQLKGEIVAVADAAVCLGLPERGARRLVAIVEGTPGKLGLLVDRLEGFREISSADLADTMLEQSAGGNRLVWATTKDLLSILDIDHLFGASQLRIRRTTAAADQPGHGTHARS